MTTIAEKVEMFIAFRNHKAEAKKELDKAMERVDEAMALLEGELLTFLQENEAQNVKSDSGTAYIRKEYSVSVFDPEIFMADVRENENWDILDVKANKTAIKKYLEEDRELPPGVKVSVINKIGVRSA